MKRRRPYIVAISCVLVLCSVFVVYLRVSHRDDKGNSTFRENEIVGLWTYTSSQPPCLVRMKFSPDGTYKQCVEMKDAALVAHTTAESDGKWNLHGNEVMMQGLLVFEGGIWVHSLEWWKVNRDSSNPFKIWLSGGPIPDPDEYKRIDRVYEPLQDPKNSGTRRKQLPP
jgi:hypothetical protein